MIGKCQKCNEQGNLSFTQTNKLLCDSCYNDRLTGNLNSFKQSSSINKPIRKQPSFNLPAYWAYTQRKTYSKYPYNFLKFWRWVLYSRSKRCEICNRTIKTWKEASIDHIIPLSKGGTHEISNLQITHVKCNQIKGSHIFDV